MAVPDTKPGTDFNGVVEYEVYYNQNLMAMMPGSEYSPHDAFQKVASGSIFIGEDSLDYLFEFYQNLDDEDDGTPHRDMMRDQGKILSEGMPAFMSRSMSIGDLIRFIYPDGIIRLYRVEGRGFKLIPTADANLPQ